LIVPGTVLLFGRLKDAFGVPSIPLPEGVTTAATLRARLVALNPDLADMLAAKTTRIAINQNLVTDEANAPLGAADEIALLPPLSGG
jgi:molybdopterin converting factor small subunit